MDSGRSLRLPRKDNTALIEPTPTPSPAQRLPAHTPAYQMGSSTHWEGEYRQGTSGNSKEEWMLNEVDMGLYSPNLSSPLTGNFSDQWSYRPTSKNRHLKRSWIKIHHTQAQKREMAGYKSVISNPKSTAEAKANAERKLKQLMNDEKFESQSNPTIGDRIHGREKNAAQEAKDEKFETVGDRVRARGRQSGAGSASASAASHYLAGDKNPKRIIAGLKASLKNPNTSEDKKQVIRDKLKSLLLFPYLPCPTLERCNDHKRQGKGDVGGVSADNPRAHTASFTATPTRLNRRFDHRYRPLVRDKVHMQEGKGGTWSADLHSQIRTGSHHTALGPIDQRMSRTVISSIVIDDRHPNVTYNGVPWDLHTSLGSTSRLYNNTDSISGVKGATATVNFYGNAVEYWGNQGPDHGPCAVSLDGTMLGMVNSFAAQEGASILLYEKDGFALGDHTLAITVLGNDHVCEIDRFVHKATLLAAAAGIIGGIAIVTLVILIIMCYRRRNLKKAARQDEERPSSSSSWSEKSKRAEKIGLRPFILPNLPISTQQQDHRPVERASDEKTRPTRRESHRARPGSAPAATTTHNQNPARRSSTRTGNPQRRSSSSSPQTVPLEVSPGGAASSKPRLPLTAPARVMTTSPRTPYPRNSRHSRRVTIDVESGVSDRATYDNRNSATPSPQSDEANMSSARPSPSSPSPKQPRISRDVGSAAAQRSNTYRSEKSRYMGSQRTTPISAGASSPASAIRGVAGPSGVGGETTFQPSVRNTESIFTDAAPPSYQS
ncbi:12074_t:CDS:10 [Acaulospora colombiana]|uniref:12074_t:CDS:1 n=1 Tax=Acaulospora colombiana TaxID=27376 RepID=A0ACA9M1P2_9GLOM|nr:12074_t:CDS:10 [Acaulospora colombiana]